MIPVPRWLTRGAPKEAEPSLRAALTETVEHFSSGRPHPVTAGLRAAVVLDDGTGEAWTVRLDHGRFELVRGRARGAEATIAGDPLTLVSVVRGKRSGLDAFLRGRLRVRGNVALALKLDALFDRRQGSSTRPRPHWMQVRGMGTSYLDAGSGPPVVLLHGLGATNAAMLTTLSALSERHRVIAPDLPGFGESDKPHAAYDPAFFAEWVVAFLDGLGLERASLVGNSMGGRVAIETALRAPDRVSKLALLAPSMAFRKFRQAVPIVRFMSPEFGALPVPVLRPHIHHGVRLLFARPERIHSSWYDAAVDEFLRVFRTPRGRVAFFATARQIYLEKPFGRRGFWDRLGTLSAPALFVWGAKDRMVPVGFARHVEALLPGARSVVLDDCGHIPQFEHPERVNALLRDFLSPAAAGRDETRCLGA